VITGILNFWHTIWKWLFEPLKYIAMIDLMKTYRDARNRAIELMQKGQLSAYIAQLARVHELKLQLMNYANTAR
jgi:hypothetical protein